MRGTERHWCGALSASMRPAQGAIQPSMTIYLQPTSSSTEISELRFDNGARCDSTARPKRDHSRDCELPLAPLNEQKRIADKLDAVLARVDACRERLDRVPAILKRFRQSVLAAATSGKLTEEWRECRRMESRQNRQECSALDEVCHSNNGSATFEATHLRSTFGIPIYQHLGDSMTDVIGR